MILLTCSNLSYTPAAVAVPLTGTRIPPSSQYTDSECLSYKYRPHMPSRCQGTVQKPIAIQGEPANCWLVSSAQSRGRQAFISPFRVCSSRKGTSEDATGRVHSAYFSEFEP